MSTTFIIEIIFQSFIIQFDRGFNSIGFEIFVIANCCLVAMLWFIFGSLNFQISVGEIALVLESMCMYCRSVLKLSFKEALFPIV